ncbi:MAG: DNA polymerase III subunit delta [Deltaproteobacteria bacterium]|nr:DNA polymerase III subunit delta [Deltaproteobacteria bacterium]
MKFSDITSDPSIKHKLIQASQDQRVSHAQLFYGPEGSGKLALAIAYSQLINCTAPKADSCGTCFSCIQHQKLAHPDLHFFYPVTTSRKVPSKPASKLYISEWREFLLKRNCQVSLSEWYDFIGVENKQGTIYTDDANEINRILGYKSYESEYKVVILWMIEKLTYAAAPKLLKILEEPPEKTLFLLISENPDHVIPTILSRCLPVRIPRGTVSEEDQFHFETFRKWMRLCFTGNVSEIIGFATETGKIGRENQKSLLQYGLQVASRSSSLQHGIPRQAFGGEEEMDFISRFSPTLSRERLPAFYDLLNTSIFHIERNAHAPTLFLDLSLKITSLFKE